MHVVPAVSLRVRDRGWFPFGRVPAVGEREESAASPPSPVKCLLAHHSGSAVPRASFLGCPLLSWAAGLGGGVLTKNSLGDAFIG